MSGVGLRALGSKAVTPEGRVKQAIKDVLNRFRPKLYHHWPVQNGMGEPTLDCNGAINGRYFAIEAKAPGKKMTPRQEVTAAKMRAAGARVFEIDGDDDQLSYLNAWCEYWMARDLVENEC